MSFSQTDSGVSYTIEGREAIDIYDQLGSAVGVYTSTFKVTSAARRWQLYKCLKSDVASKIAKL